MLQVQYRNIRSSDIAEFSDMEKQVILTPARYKTGDVIYPYIDAKK
jgi:hypothetical protein